VKEAEVDTNDRPTRPLYRGPERYQLERMGDLGTSNLSVSHLEVHMENVKPSKPSSKVPLFPLVESLILGPLFRREVPEVLLRPLKGGLQ
jgi:hypothetical protein